MHHFAHLTVLAVDDDAVTLKVIQHLLRKIVKVEICSSAIEALSILQRQRIDLILSDMEMPEMSGRELLDRLKATPGLRDIPFIFLSSIHEQDTWLESLDAGARDFLVKPVEPSLLSAKVKAWLRPLSVSDSHADEFKKSDNGFHIWNLLGESHALDINADGVYIHFQLPHGLLPDAILYRNEVHALHHLKPLEKAVFGAVRLKIQVYEEVFRLPNSNSYPQHLLSTTLSSLLTYKPLLQAEMQEEFKQAVKKTSILQNEQFELRIGPLKIIGLSQSYGGMAGGDFIDQIWLNDGSCLLAIGDVMGKLWGAWFVSMGYLAYFRTLVKAHTTSMGQKFSLIRLMEELNAAICRDLQLAEVFTTLSLIHISPEGRSYQLVNAGFLPRIGSDDTISKLPIQGTLLGLTYQATYECIEGSLKAGQFIVIPTDGWAEARPNSGEGLVGEEAFDQFLLNIHHSGGPHNNFPDKFNEHFQVSRRSDDASLIWISATLDN